MSDPEYAVVSPVGPKPGEVINLQGPLTDLRGKTVCELWDWLFRGSVMFPLIREQLASRFPGVRIVDYDAFGNTHRDGDPLADLPGFLRQQGCDLVISGIGA